jgi:hypothetical protein
MKRAGVLQPHAKRTRWVRAGDLSALTRASRHLITICLRLCLQERILQGVLEVRARLGSARFATQGMI